jgi:hypothetical protein
MFLNEGKFALAMELGCTRTISALDPNLMAVKDVTQGGSISPSRINLHLLDRGELVRQVLLPNDRPCA